MIKFARNLFGEVGKTLLANECVLSETVYAPRANLPMHSHGFSYLCFVLQGDYLERLGGREHHCAASTLAFHPEGESHSDAFGKKGGRCLNIQFSLPFAQRMQHASLIPERSLHFQTGELSNLAAKIYDEFARPDAVSPFVIEALITEIVAKTARSSVIKCDRVTPRWLERTRDILHAHFSESLHLVGIAALVDRHPVHVARGFRKYFGCSIGEYVRNLRVEYARGQLTQTDRPLAEIALDAGFAQQSHFSAIFKRTTGISPSACRENSRSR